MTEKIQKTITPLMVGDNKLIGPIALFVEAAAVFKKDNLNFILNTVFRAVAYLPVLIVSFLYVIIASVFQSDNLFLSLIFLLLTFVAWVASVFLIVRLDIQLFLFMKKSNNKFWDVWYQGAKYFWIYIALLLSMVIAIFLGSLLFILPGLILAVFSSLVLCAAIFEDLKYGEAIKRGFSLVTKNWFGIFARLILLVLAFFLVFFVIRIIFSFFSETGLFLLLHKMLSMAVFYLGYTFVIIYSSLIYKSSVGKK